MKSIFSIEDISRNRNALMGFAILWVISFHYHLQTPIISKIASYGYIGVDVFFFLSGLGLYFSMHQQEDTKQFYWKRIKRIFPMFFVLGAFSCLLYGSFDSYIWKHTTLGYWTDGVITSWFIPAIVTCYFLYPFLYHAIFKRGDILLYTILISILLFLVTYKVVVEGKTMNFEGFQPDWYRLMFWYRLPIFLFGSLIGYCIVAKWKKHFFILVAILCLIPATALYLQRQTMCLCFATSFVTPLIVLLLCVFLNKMPLVVIFLERIGRASLETFIIHMPVFYYANNHFDWQLPHDINAVIIALFVIITSITIHGLNFTYKSYGK